MTYIDDARASLERQLPSLKPELIDLYLVLALVAGDGVTLEDVHDAWAVWQSRTRPDHHSIKPFDELAPEVQELDRRYAEAIIAIALDRS